MFIRQLHLAYPGSQLPTGFDSARRTTQLVVHLFTKLADAAFVWLAEDPPEGRASIASSVVPGHQPSNVTDQPHNRGMLQQKTTAKFRPPEPTYLPQKGPAENLNARFDSSLALMTLGRTVSRQSPMHSGVRNRPHQRFRRRLTVSM